MKFQKATSNPKVITTSDLKSGEVYLCKGFANKVIKNQLFLITDEQDDDSDFLGVDLSTGEVCPFHPSEKFIHIPNPVLHYE